MDVCTISGEVRCPLSILVADDEELLRESVAELLRERGHAVAAVGSAREALDNARLRMPNLAIIDWRMPGGGASVIQELLAAPSFQGRILLMTGSIEGDEVAALGGHVERFQKPFSFKGLLARVEEIGQELSVPIP
ncbi:MAG: response regulator [Gemmatimonadales bacterium]|nr:MAG: response regulator [Gemmatimonadales bacterium]